MDGEDSIKEYVDITYDEDGESVPYSFYVDFNIGMNETDEDKIEKAVYKSRSSNLVPLLAGCSYEGKISNKGERIYPVTFKEHLYRWHGGSYKNSLPGKPLNDSVDNDY
ncbi:immunity 22 family protein [Rossellomorea vietnamensis]|nr:immunity 22 family protein [Rossellomorea vietnamensis]